MTDRLLVALLSFACVAGQAGVAPAQWVQLPTYRVFQMPLNVVVPDRGTAVVGGYPPTAFGNRLDFRPSYCRYERKTGKADWSNASSGARPKVIGRIYLSLELTNE